MAGKQCRQHIWHTSHHLPGPSIAVLRNYSSDGMLVWPWAKDTFFPGLNSKNHLLPIPACFVLASVSPGQCIVQGSFMNACASRYMLPCWGSDGAKWPMWCAGNSYASSGGFLRIPSKSSKSLSVPLFLSPSFPFSTSCQPGGASKDKQCCSHRNHRALTGVDSPYQGNSSQPTCFSWLLSWGPSLMSPNGGLQRMGSILCFIWGKRCSRNIHGIWRHTDIMWIKWSHQKRRSKTTATLTCWVKGIWAAATIRTLVSHPRAFSWQTTYLDWPLKGCLKNLRSWHLSGCSIP